MNQNGALYEGTVLVTGGTGFLGVPLVERLVKNGERVRVLGRRPKVRWQRNPAIEHIRADIADPGVVDDALRGVRRVYHLAAATEGDWESFKRGTIDASAFLLRRMAEFGGGRVVFVSSLGNYDGNAMRDGIEVSEDFPIEQTTSGRGYYALAKTQAERIAQEYLSHPNIRLTILRPGVIYGPRAKNPLAGVAMPFKGKFWIMFGKGDKPLPLVYLDDVIEALVRVMSDDRSIGKIYNLVHPEQPTQNECFFLYRRFSGDRRPLLRIPLHRLIGVLSVADRVLRRARRRDSELAYMARRLVSRVRYRAERIKDDIGFEPGFDLTGGLGRIYSGNK